MRSNALTRQLAEETAIKSLVLKRDALSREVAQLQNAKVLISDSKSMFEAQRNLLRQEIQKLETQKQTLKDTIDIQKDTINDLQLEIKTQENAAANIHASTILLKHERENAVLALDELDQEQEVQKGEFLNTITRLRDEKSQLLYEVQQLQDQKDSIEESRETEALILETKAFTLEEKEKQLSERAAVIEQVSSDTHVLRARLKQLADTHTCKECGTSTPIHFNIKI